ncbi:MAG: NADH:flavin oxidoreductase [Desulfarculus sp.]|nr:NADH:flavin oxidoreductase [Pseudomonadota bacterium]MBV1716040.1 NADH:flavin oxidoreductase [Desulfarculus sp.]MBU4575157.1 NADH:flavin oxidoreductase [Pseudomonadota bacterium]MBU4596624.1 NADH:flavin oxidoreductase [Pseudomonadota bacterium]MBV1738477.1 NADH:flavin oxidoreductase [Desulfarculus sp.]
MPSLFESTNLAGMTLRNRLMRSATWERMADGQGRLTPRLERTLLDIAEGGAALIFPGYAFVTAQEQPNPGMLGIYDDACVPDLERLTEGVHQRGAAIGLQLAYGGSFTNYRPEGRLIWGPSAVPHPATEVVPQPMSLGDIQSLVEAFALAAGRAQRAGFDCVQMHSSHGYLLSQFLSPYFNRREDAYGGSLENRCRIHREILAAIRRETGHSYPVLIKINSADHMPGGLSAAESLEACRILDGLGIDGIEISGGVRTKDPDTYFVKPHILKPERQSYYRPYAEAVARAVKAPVILVGGNRDARMLQQMLDTTAIAYFSLSRTLISEPDLVNRWRDDSAHQPRCRSCNQCFDPAGHICVLDRKAAQKA